MTSKAINSFFLYQFSAQWFWISLHVDPGLKNCKDKFKWRAIQRNPSTYWLKARNKSYLILLILCSSVGKCSSVEKIIWFFYVCTYLIQMSIEIRFLWQGNQAKSNHFYRISFSKTTKITILPSSKKGKYDKKS